MAIIPGANDFSAALARLRAVAKRGDVDLLVIQLADFVQIFSDRVRPKIRDKAIEFLGRKNDINLNIPAFDPDDLLRARIKLRTEAINTLTELENIPYPETSEAIVASTSSSSTQNTSNRTNDDASSKQDIRRPDANAVVDAIGITLSYSKSNFRLDPVDIKLKQKEILAIIGVNGSGKSTLIDMLRGALAPSKGTVYYPRLSPDPSDWQKIRSRIGYVPQRSNRWKGTVRENLEYAAATHKIVGIDNTDYVEYLLNRHGLKRFENYTWSRLSSGYRLRFDLALARINRPSLLILDEPMANLDLISQQELLRDIKELANTFDTAVIITSQHLYDMEIIATSSIILAEGKSIGRSQPKNRRFFELWPADGRSFDASQVEHALAAFKPLRVWVDATTCLVEVPSDVDLVRLSEEARSSQFPLLYARDVTYSARTELDPRIVINGPQEA